MIKFTIVVLLISSIDLIHYIVVYILNKNYEQTFMKDDFDHLEMKSTNFNNFLNAVDVSGFTIG